ncbi:MAG: T9SS type A sorting domain-containing protein, partial [bacterium]|nr:T9SS type A sorting domain-containing protein [bacterium]
TGISGQSARCSTTMSTSQFTIIDAIALPVKLLSFVAEEEIGYNTIRWEVAEEENIEKYILEYSTNGVVFGTVDEIAYNPANYNTYVSTHMANPNENAYYRLSTIDRDGNITVLSDVITISKNINSTLTIYPNPNNGTFTINFFSTKELQTEFTITDMFGKTVQTIQGYTKKGENVLPITLDADLANGFYHITFKYGTSSRTIRASILR